MIDYIHSDLFNQGSIRKDMVMEYIVGTDVVKHITNKDIVASTFSLNESAFSGDELRFGSLVSSKMAFKIFNSLEDSIIGKELNVKEVINDDLYNLFSYGKFKVASEKVTADRLYRQIEAYDSLYEVVNRDVADWYESLSFPLTMKSFRDSFFDYIGIEQVNDDLVNDNMTVTKTISPTTLSGKDVLTAICEINGAIGRINRDSKFAYVTLNPNPTTRIEMKRIQSGTGSYEDFNFEPISKLQIKQTDNDIGVIVGEDGNTYIVQDNFLVYGKDNYELTVVANNLLSVIRGITYKPFKAKFIYGNPCYEIGDPITVFSKNATFNSYILERTLYGINSVTDEIIASGNQEISDNLNSNQSQFIQLERRTNELVRTVDGMESKITKNVIGEVIKDIQVGGVNLVDNSWLFGCVDVEDVELIYDEDSTPDVNLRDDIGELITE